MDCIEINQRTRGHTERVAEINSAAPDCTCELTQMSSYSSGPVSASESLARFIFSPVHVRPNGSLKPSVFSHVASKGCSIQRDSIASSTEIGTFIVAFLSSNESLGWLGLLIGRCEYVREIRVGDSIHPAVCVYDTGNSDNPSHGEMGQTHYVVNEADGPELRRRLFVAFNNGEMTQPTGFRAGQIWSELPLTLRDRTKK